MRSLFPFVLALALLGGCEKGAPIRPDPSRASVEPVLLEADPGKLVVRAPPKHPRRRIFRDAAIDAKLDDLRKDPVVGAAHVGAAGSESEFHRIAREVLPLLDEDDVRWLVADDAPAVRSLGFMGLALRGDRAALLQHVCDRELVEVCPGGCLCGHETVGAIAQHFLAAPTWLGAGAIGIPSKASETPRGDTRALEVRLAATDACGPPIGGRRWERALDDLGWEELKHRAEGVPDWVLVKALGRSGQVPVHRLESILADAHEPRSARIAAASALTRSSSTDAEQAVPRNATFLDSLGSGTHDALVAAIRTRRAVEAAMQPIEAVHTWMETEKLASNAIDAFKARHVLVAKWALSGIHYGARDPEVMRARGESLLWIAEHLDDHRACWDTYRDTAYVLGRRLDQTSATHDWLGELMTPEQASRFTKSVTEAIARLDSDTSCP